MFEQMKAMGQMAALLRDKDRLRELGDSFRRRLDGMSVTGSAGGGVCRVTVSGQMRITQVALDDGLANGIAHDKGMGERLIEEATNDALDRMQRLVAEQAQLFAREHGLPDLPGMENMGRMLASG